MASISVENLQPQPKASLSSHQTALAILLPSTSPYHQDILTLRSLYDKNSETWPPHINLLYPFASPEYLPTAVDMIQKYLTTRFDHSAIPLTVKLDTAGIWKHKDHATIYLSASTEWHDNSNESGKLEPLELQKQLLSLFSTPTEAETTEYTLHLTIGQTALNEEVMMGLLGKAQKLVANAGSSGIRWNVSRLVVLQRGAAKSGMWIMSEIGFGRQSLVEEGYGRESPDPKHDSSQRFGPYPVYAFSSVIKPGAYVPRMEGKIDLPEVQALTLATYNVFADSAMPTAIAKSRYPLLLSAILSTTASVVNLQEVTDDFLAYLLSQSEIQHRFPYSTHSLSHGILPSWRNCVIIASYPLGDENGMWQFVDLGRHKGAVVVELHFIHATVASPNRPQKEEYDRNISKDTMKKRLVIANVHLTCGISDGASAAKVTQMHILSSYFLGRKMPNNYTEAWAICGDFNIPTSHSTINTAYASQEISQETYRLLLNTDGYSKGVIPEIIADIEDLKFDLGEASRRMSGDLSPHWEPGSSYAWGNALALGPGEFGATFNPFTNHLCAKGVKWGANPRPQRYDRILISHNTLSGEQNWIEVKRTGRFGIEGGSDHWGLYAEIRVRDRTAEEKGTSLGQKTCLELEPKLQAQGDMTDEALEKYLSDSGMIPSQEDYAIREEAKSVLTTILTGVSRGHHNHRTPPPVHSISLTSMQNLDASPQYEHPVGESRISLVSLAQGLEKPQVKIIVQAVGSYYMNLFTPTSDVDILCASNISARVFWALVKQKIRRHNRTLSETGGKSGSIRILRTVEAQSGTMLELEYIAAIHNAKYEHYCVRIDLQYCQVPERVLDSWGRLPYLSPSDPIFSLPAITLKKLNAYRDSSYLLQTIPNFKLFRLTYLLLKLWATRRGIFSARFGYLGGIHIVFLLSHVFKIIATEQVVNLTACEALRLFFKRYASFNYEEDTVGDPDFIPSQYRRTVSREPLVIQTIHSPMVNVASTASQHSLQTLRDQILSANQKHDTTCSWEEVTGLDDGEAERDFLNAFSNFVKIDLRYWGRNTTRGRSLLGWIESRCVHLLVELNAKVPNMRARIWPARFVNIDEPHTNEELNAFYLIGLVNTSSSLRSSLARGSEEAQAVNEQKKRVYNKFMEILRSFEEYLREEEKKYEVTESYVSVTRVNRQSLGEGVRIDRQVWWDEDYAEVGATTKGRYNYNPSGGEDDEDSLDEEDSASDYGDVGERERSCSLGAVGVMDDFLNTDHHKSTQVPQKRTSRSQHKRERRNNQATDEMVILEPRQEYIKKAKLRPAHDIINRIKWDSDMDIHDYLIGYEDRFLGILQMNLEKWVGHRRDETDEEWMPMHRVVWITRASDGEVVWHKEKRIDTIFGSCSRATRESGEI
ncbi:hypothetical protein BGX38DRAFT_1228084 [Terfezia claveryi]|nr:hypothetical protein BGX38DRAFT_1228084 [Terfezia claveryi]